MMTQILFVQGGGAGVHDEWDDKLMDSLARKLGRDYDVRYPRVPDEDDPACASWSAALEQAIAALDALLIGHSIGGTHPRRRSRREAGWKIWRTLHLAAPFVGAGGRLNDEMPAFPELTARPPKAIPAHLCHGVEDERGFASWG